MKKILIVDDHPIVRQGLMQILNQEPDLTVAGEAEDAEKAITLLKTQGFDCLILDLAMPKLHGLEALKEIKKVAPMLPILILSIHSEDHYAIRALKSGAAGFLSKDAPPEVLLKAIRRVSEGKKFATPTVAEKLVNFLDTKAVPPHETFSNREFQIFLLLAQGQAPKNIANTYSISVKTVSTYRSRILSKLGMERNSEMVQYALENGLLKK